jgi:carbon-monoxide dehydrogenase medium subunit
MYPRVFRYHRAASLQEASSLLAELGEEAKLLAGGQSLIPLMKLRLANPQHLIDLSFIPSISYIRQDGDTLRFGPLTRHSDIEFSDVAAQVPIIHDCAAGIADPQVRNRGTIGGSIAEADPSGDWGPVLLTLDTHVRCLGPNGERTLPLSGFFVDAYTTVLAREEVVKEVSVKVPGRNSGGAYVAFKRCAPVYASASVAVQLTLEDGTCKDAGIALGAVGLTTIKASQAEAELRGQRLDSTSIERAAEAASAECDPLPDMRGSVEFKRNLVGALLKRAIAVAQRRARGERVPLSHQYA